MLFSIGVWWVLPLVAGAMCLVKGRYYWTLVGILPITLLFIVAALEHPLGWPGWMATVEGLAVLAFLFAPLAVVGAVQSATPNSLLVRRQTAPVSSTESSGDSPSTAYDSRLSSGFALLVITVALTAAGLFIDSRLDARAYQSALTAEPVGETVLTDFQFAPNFNSGQVWRLTGTVDFPDPTTAAVDRWEPGKPRPPAPTHPGIDHGPAYGPPVEAIYAIRLNFDQPHGLTGQQRHVAVTCRIYGHTSSWAYPTYRVLDVCRDLQLLEP